MTDLELQLRDVGRSVEYPPTPDLARAVRLRLAERRPRWSARSRRQALALVLAGIVVAAAAALAVPQARTAILRFLRIGAVTVERVETLPEARERPLTAGLGRPVPRDEAARRTGFRLPLPPEVEVDRVYVRDRLQAALLEHDEAGPVLLMGIRGRSQFTLAKKLAGQGTRFSEVSVNGSFGLWIEGAPHVVLFEDRYGRIRELRTRLAGNVLVWTRGALTLRLEGELTRRQALELARSLE